MYTHVCKLLFAIDDMILYVCVLSVSGNTTETLLNIVTSQRERFKQRNIELEAVCFILFVVDKIMLLL